MFEHIDGFLVSCVARGLSPQTVRWYGDLLGAAAAGVQGSDAAAVEAWLAGESRRGLSPASVSARWRALRAYANWCKRRGLLGPTVWAGVESPRVPRRRGTYCTAAQFGALVAAVGGDDWVAWRDRAALWLLMWSGLRAGELVSLLVDDVDLVGRWLLVRGGKTGARVAPMHVDAVRVVGEYLARRPDHESRALLLTADSRRPPGAGGALRVPGLRALMLRRCAAARLPPLTPQTMRRGCGVALLSAGAPSAVVRDVLGHASVTTTERYYAWYADGALQAAYDAAAGRVGR